MCVNPHLILCLLAMFAVRPATAGPRMLDDFETLSGWTAIPSEGAKLNIVSGEGKDGKAMVMEFDLLGVYGYVIARKEFNLDLPANYQFTFDMRADAPVNNFEFKLIDAKDNVFWIKKLNIEYPTAWTRQRIAKRHITFAWGPAGGGEIRQVQKIEFVVSTGTGGKGKVFIDNFRFEPIDDAAAARAHATLETSSRGRDSKPVLNTAGTMLTDWSSAGTGGSEWISIDFDYLKEIGGLVIDWDSLHYATAYDVELSDDGHEWTTAYSVTEGNGGRDYLSIPESLGRFLRLKVKTSNSGKRYAITRLEVKGPAFSSQPNDFFSVVAHESPRGFYPRYFLQQQTNWTIVGSSGDRKEALLNELGALEVDKLSFSIEPFLFVNNRLVTWNDVSLKQSLENNYLPIPSVEWTYGQWRLTVRAFSAGTAGSSLLIATYRLENSGGPVSKAKLFLALRPFQVNPPWQWLNAVGGAARIDSITTMGGILRVNDKTVIPLVTPTAFGATTFDRGDIVEYLQKGIVPKREQARDLRGAASAALEYDVDVPSGESVEFHLVVPFHQWRGSPTAGMDEGGSAYVSLALASTIQYWESKLGRVSITLPATAQPIVNTIKSNLAYIFINRDGQGIQPGSRSYERSWIRDGSLTSTALLEMGIKDEVREFIDWYAEFQFPDGKIPCVVDTRGGDPTSEHDSHGEFIYSVLTYFQFSQDSSWLRNKFDRVVGTVRYIQSLRAGRKTDLYRQGDAEQRACFGLLPESISHEGYSDHPRHSYWDDFFALKGLKDATTIAEILGEKKLAAEFAAERDDLRKDLYASMRLVIETRKIDYIPGCVELGDFDATSTTIGVDPCGELGNIPEPQLHNTFDKYYEFFSRRRDNLIEWKNYTPYETRIIGTFVHLGEKDRALDALDFFLKDRRPAPWNQWAEVVYRDPSTPGFIGDMPHTWVGSDFIRSVRAMLVYERDNDGALVIGAGIPEKWLDDSTGVAVQNLPTRYGNVSYSMKKVSERVMVRLSGDVRVPGGKIIVISPRSLPVSSVRVDGKKSGSFNAGQVAVEHVPATIEMFYHKDS
jgi:F5/8 type C domain